MLITPNEILISFENSTVFQIKLDVSIKSVQKFCNMAIICFGCNFANWLSEMKIMNEIVEIASKVGWHRTAPCRYRGKAELTAAPLYLSLLSP